MIDLFPNSTFFFQLAIFLAVVAVVSQGILKPILKVLDLRRQKSAESLDHSAQLEKMLADKLARYDDGLREAKQEALKRREATLRAAASEEKQIIAAARKDSEEKLAEVGAQLQAEVEQAKARLGSDAQALAALLVQQVLRVLVLVIGVSGATTSGVAIAEEHAVHATGIPMGIWFHSINLLILVAILVKLLRQPLKEFFAGRKAAIEKAVNAAEERRQAFAQRARAVETKLATLTEEIQRLKHDIVTSSEAEKRELIARARLAATKITENVALLAEQELQKARESLKQYALSLSFQLAEKQLEKTMARAEEERRFEEKVVTELRGSL